MTECKLCGREHPSEVKPQERKMTLKEQRRLAKQRYRAKHREKYNSYMKNYYHKRKEQENG